MQEDGYFIVCRMQVMLYASHTSYVGSNILQYQYD